jgi:hypothetical protein
MMIVFDLHCDHGHTFEEWFASRAEYDRRHAAREIACPECGGTSVTKALSAPRINGGAAAPSVGPCGLPACGAGICQGALPR